jgi:hypothetical protein
MSADGDQPTDYRLAVLRAAGFQQAAELSSKLPAAPEAKEPEPEPEPERQQQPQRPLTAAEIAEAQRRAQGEALRGAMNRQLGPRWATFTEEDAA